MDRERRPTFKAKGSTAAERYLAALCERTFLSFWSYPTVYRDELLPKTKEVCDLLVIFENDIIIFSDKNCCVPNSGNLDLDWKRWFRRAVVESMRQAAGAQRWIQVNPTRLFLDPSCRQQLPITPTIDPQTKFHLVVVAHQIAQRCRKELGGSGSLMIQSDVVGVDRHTTPFVIGDLSPDSSFVHVLDDTSLQVVLRELDTVSDFVAYLNAKERLIRARAPKVLAAGEEELLEWYLRHADTDGNHQFVAPDPTATGIALAEGHYAEYLEHPQRLAKVRANEISYAWDALIERFSRHAFGDTQYFRSDDGLQGAERILRFLAREHRVRRRMLAQALVTAVTTTPSNLRRTMVVEPLRTGDPHYLFLTIPWDASVDERTNRERRLWFLRETCRVVKLVCPAALDVVGIATESGNDQVTRSEDAAYLDCRQWSAEDERDAREFQAGADVLTTYKRRIEPIKEYPDLGLTKRVKSGRNDPCPCGSGLKFKKCHGRPCD